MSLSIYSGANTARHQSSGGVLRTQIKLPATIAVLHQLALRLTHTSPGATRAARYNNEKGVLSTSKKIRPVQLSPSPQEEPGWAVGGGRKPSGPLETWALWAWGPRRCLVHTLPVSWGQVYIVGVVPPVSLGISLSLLGTTSNHGKWN